MDIGPTTVLFGVLILAGVALSVAGMRFVATPARLFGAGAIARIMGTIAGVGGPVLALACRHESGARLRATLALPSSRLRC
jgi:hypothetical protein